MPRYMFHLTNGSTTRIEAPSLAEAREILAGQGLEERHYERDPEPEAVTSPGPGVQDPGEPANGSGGDDEGTDGDEGEGDGGQFDVASSNITEVMDWVNEDPDARAQVALDAEVARGDDARSSLVAQLEALIVL